MSISAAPSSPDVIRPARPADWDAIAALLSASGLPLDGARDHLDGFLVAERDRAIVGCAAVERHGDAGLLRSVAVAGAGRRRGTGRALVSRALAQARRARLTTIVLLTTTAESYFQRLGFATVTREDVPPTLLASAEFRGACPATATVMRLDLPYSSGSAGPAVRRARPADAESIAAIYNMGIRERMATFETRERTAADVAPWLADPRHPVFVAEMEGRVAGWIAASTYRARECYAGIAEFSVYVDPSARGNGVGDALMSEFLPALEAAGFWKVLSRIFPENGASLSLCRRHHFREVGTYVRHGKLDGAWRDVVIVERLLGEAVELATS